MKRIRILPPTVKNGCHGTRYGRTPHAPRPTPSHNFSEFHIRRFGNVNSFSRSQTVLSSDWTEQKGVGRRAWGVILSKCHFLHLLFSVILLIFYSWAHDPRPTTHDPRPLDFTVLHPVPNGYQLHSSAFCPKSGGRGGSWVVGRGCTYPRIVHPSPRRRVYVLGDSTSESTTTGVCTGI